MVMVILGGVQRSVAGETVSMPAFDHELGSAEVALLANYVLKTYGNPAAATLDASAVDLLRNDMGEQPVVARLALPGMIAAGIVIVLLLI